VKQFTAKAAGEGGHPEARGKKQRAGGDGSQEEGRRGGRGRWSPTRCNESNGPLDGRGAVRLLDVHLLGQPKVRNDGLVARPAARCPPVHSRTPTPTHS